MNEILGKILEQVQAKLLDKDIPQEGIDTLKSVETEIKEMLTKIWTVEDSEQINAKLKAMTERLNNIQEKQKCSEARK